MDVLCLLLHTAGAQNAPRSLNEGVPIVGFFERHRRFHVGTIHDELDVVKKFFEEFT